MGKGRRYDQEYKDMIVELFKSGMSLAELSSEYGIAKSTINGWIKDVKEIKVDENEVMTLKEVKALKKEMARIKEENEILHPRRVLAKTNYWTYLCAITVKKYKPHSNKKVAEGLENVLKKDFTTTSINEKWIGDITYISKL